VWTRYQCPDRNCGCDTICPPTRKCRWCGRWTPPMTIPINCRAIRHERWYPHRCRTGQCRGGWRLGLMGARWLRSLATFSYALASQSCGDRLESWVSCGRVRGNFRVWSRLDRNCTYTPQTGQVRSPAIVQTDPQFGDEAVEPTRAPVLDGIGSRCIAKWQSWRERAQSRAKRMCSCGSVLAGLSLANGLNCAVTEGITDPVA
jgi:hypothetical protein